MEITKKKYLYISAGIFIILLSLFVVNCYNKNKTFESIDEELTTEEWNHLSEEEHLYKCYTLVANRFGSETACWRKHPLRNFYSTNMWDLQGECLPCHIHNKLFQRCLLKRFDKDAVRTKVTSCIDKNWALIHYHTQVYSNKDWTDVDIYFAKKGIKFGKYLCGG